MKESPIHLWLFNQCLDAGLSELEYALTRERFNFYINERFLKQDALRASLLEVLANFN